MKMLTKSQWDVLSLSGKKAGASLDENLNTISSLYCRSLIRFKTIKGSRRLVTMQLGSMYLKFKPDFGRSPDFYTSRKLAKQSRGEKK